MPFTAITNNIDWQAAAFLNEYVDANNERRGVDSSLTNLSTVVAGDDIQAASGILGDLQDSLDAFSEFIDPDVADYNGDAALPDAMTLNEAYTAAGIASGYRRTATMTAEDWTVYGDWDGSYGHIQAGDIIGPWIFADLQSMFGVLTRTKGTVGTYTGSSSYAADQSSAVSWAAAQALAVANYGSQGASGPGEAYTIGTFIAGTYRAIATRTQSNVSSPATPWGVEQLVTWYLKPKPESVGEPFDHLNDKRHDTTTDIVNAVLNKMLVETFTGSSPTTTRTSTGVIGSVAASTFPATWTADPVSAAYTSRGWRTDSTVFTRDWNWEYAPSPLF
jgi:hypothetical protein